MSREYPNSTELVLGGESYEGRQLLGLRINTPSLHKQGKPVFFIESGKINLLMYKGFVHLSEGSTKRHTS